jgi:hypothetical protein
MEQRFIDDYEKREFIGRESLLELQELNPKSFKYEFHFTTEKYAVYDAHYFSIDNETQNIKKRIWIEIKVRTQEYDGYVLEKKKLKSMIDLRDKLYLNKDEVSFLYICFLPTKTLIWNITNIDLNDTTELKANKSTSNNRTDKIDKDVIMLNEKDARCFNFVADERRVMKRYSEKYLLPKIEKKKQDLLWNFLQFGPNEGEEE